MKDLEGTVTAREGYIHEEIEKSLDRERDLWQKEREAHAITTYRERGPLQVKTGLFRGYIGVLIG